MTNKNRAIIHFTVGIITALIISVTFLILIMFDIGLKNITSPWEFFGVAFGVSIFVFLVIYGLLTISLCQGSKPIRMLLPWVLTTFVISIFIGLFTCGIDWANIDFSSTNTTSKLLLNSLFFIMIIFSSLIILIISQAFNTKFLLISTSNGRADQWEISNFLQMFINRANIKHENSHSILYSKNKKMVIKFIPEEELERKLVLSGDIISRDVSEIKKNLKKGEKGAIVYLSNKLPEIQGTDQDILVIKNENLFKEFKKINSMKGK